MNSLHFTLLYFDLIGRQCKNVTRLYVNMGAMCVITRYYEIKYTLTHLVTIKQDTLPCNGVMITTIGVIC